MNYLLAFSLLVAWAPFNVIDARSQQESEPDEAGQEAIGATEAGLDTSLDVDTALTIESAAVADTTAAFAAEEVPGDTLAIGDTTAIPAEEIALPPPADTLAKVEIPATLDAGYKGFGWGMSPDMLADHLGSDTALSSEQEGVISVPGVLGEDTVRFNYCFSDKGFWKVRIDYRLAAEKLDDYVGHFVRIEKLLTKRYGPSKRTTRNEMGTDREYLFSHFPKLTRAYFRSSWIVDKVRIELLLEARVPLPGQKVPVFDDILSTLRLYYYHPDYYEELEPATTEIPEETLIESF